MKLWKFIQSNNQEKVAKKRKELWNTIFDCALICKEKNRLERFVLYTNLIISNFITCIYRKLTINYSKFCMKNYQACFFYEDLANSRIFLLWHARWERRLPPLPKKLPWHSMFSSPLTHKFSQKCFGPFWWENTLFQQLTSVWKNWIFFISKLFLVATFLPDHF